MTNNIFLKHPKITLFAFSFLILIILVIGFEKYIAWTNIDTREKEGAERYVVLREKHPFSVRYDRPNIEVLKVTDSLRNKAYRLEIDEDGFIFPSRVHEKPDIRIFFLGGSSTECMYVDELNRFPYLVGRLLEKENIKVNSYNSGVSGNNTLHLMNILLNKIIPYNPEVVVMMENINDLVILLYEGDYWNKNIYKGPIRYKKIEPFYPNIKGTIRSAIPNLYARLRKIKNDKIKDEFSYIRGKKIIINKEYLIKKYRNNLQTFINICNANGIRPVLMTQASRFKEKPDKVVIDYTSIMERDFGVKYPEFRAVFELFNDVIRDVGKANDVLVIDLARQVPQEKEYIFDYDHYNDNGSRFVAKIIADELLNNNLLNTETALRSN